MSWQALTQALVLVVLLAATVPFLGRYMADVYGRLTGRVDDVLVARMRGIALAKAVGIAMNAKPVTLAMGWRALDALGLVVR